MRPILGEFPVAFVPGSGVRGLSERECGDRRKCPHIVHVSKNERSGRRPARPCVFVGASFGDNYLGDN
jgi:hypothetical protein